MRTPPLSIRVILHYYYSPEPCPEERTVAVQSTIRHFLGCGMLEETTEESGYKTTARGKAWVEMICTTPFPEEKTVWVNPLTKEVLN